MNFDLDPIRNSQYRAGDIRHCVADPHCAQELLGFEATTTLEEGMGELMNWLAGQEAVDQVDHATYELASRGLTRWNAMQRSENGVAPFGPERHRACEPE